MSVERGTAAMLVRRRERLAQGAEPIGWKVGFNISVAQQKLGIDAPLAGFLSTDGLLENGAEVSLADGPVVEVQDVPLDLMLPDVRHLVDDPASLPLREARERFDRQVILRVLERVRWNQSEAARLLGLHRNSLKTKLLAWGIDPVALASVGGRADGGRPDGRGAQ